MSFLLQARRKIFKRWAKNAFFPGLRLRLLRAAGVRIGAEVYIAEGLTIVEDLAGGEVVTIGDRASFGPNVTLVLSSHPNRSRIRSVAPIARGSITIGADAWIGAGAVVLPGVSIGPGAVVGALAVVTTDVPALEVVAGQPARRISQLPPPPGWA